MTGQEPTARVRASDRVRVRRNPKKGRYDAETIGSILDRAVVCCVAFVDGGEPICLPTLCARVGERIYIHGSSASRALRALSQARSACVTVTRLHGLVLARSAFENTVNYESVVAFGRFQPIVNREERPTRHLGGRAGSELSDKRLIRVEDWKVGNPDRPAWSGKP
jgi:nitroimidazol reductase NimA-like FMN-containing flavoprotein (pyridoxamine 5'-phosphate oxidase superfamily)